MQELTPGGEQAVQNLAQRYRVSGEAVRTMLFAVSAGGGTMAQFYIPELGGGGQWMRGGMTMVGDMFNSGLQATVSNLCGELSSLLANQQVFAPLPLAHTGNGFMFSGNSWWPAELGSPSSSGGQNDARYAYFPHVQRLAIDRGGQITVYNTLDHSIGGVQQQQGGAYGSLSFSSQFGTFGVDSLPIVSPMPMAPPPAYEPAPPAWQPAPAPAPAWSAPAPAPSWPAPSSSPSSFGAPQSQAEILSSLERLGQLFQQGVLTDIEFKTKKADLLARL
jgi:hypothetical protein